MSDEFELAPELLLRAYCQGLFPMAQSRRDRRVAWYSPDPRAILPLDAVRFPRSLLRRVRRGDYIVTRDVAFEAVIRGCAQPRPYSAETWINEPIIRGYTQLHQLGYAHSVEAWLDDREARDGGASGEPSPGQTQDAEGRLLVGGLYGVAIGRAFFGESMFSRATDASKVCLVHLVEHLRQRGFTLLDVQFTNPHMAQFGVVEIPRMEYLRRLHEALRDTEPIGRF